MRGAGVRRVGLRLLPALKLSLLRIIVRVFKRGKSLHCLDVILFIHPGSRKLEVNVHSFTTEVAGKGKVKLIIEE